MENRRRDPRYETEFEARIYAEDFSFSATVIDISKGGVGILSENPIETGSSEEHIVGIPAWSHYIEKEGKCFYRIGLETQSLDLENLKAIGLPKRSELVSEILSQRATYGHK